MNSLYGGDVDKIPDPRHVYETNVPNRLDRLPWAGFHWLVIFALGIAWILDGLEVTIVGSLSGALSESPALHLTGSQIGAAASAYLVGAVGGALFFGWLTDRLGRKKLFTVTVLVYLVATIACGLSWNFWSFAFFRLLTGAGIGGEYAAVNATIQELIPARRRGFTDLVINGSFWLGAAIGALGATSCWTRRSCRRRSAGAPPLSSAACWASSCCCCAASCRKARAG